MSAQSQNNSPPPTQETSEGWGFIWLALAGLCLFVMLWPTISPTGGGVWTDWRKSLTQQVGWLAYVLPVPLLLFGFGISFRKPELVRWAKSAALILAAFWLLHALLGAGTAAHPSSAGRLADAVILRLNTMLGPFTILILLALGFWGLRMVAAHLSSAGLADATLGRLSRWSHSARQLVQSTVDTHVSGPRHGESVLALDRAEQRKYLGELAQKIDTLRRLSPKTVVLREPHEMVAKAQRELHTYDADRLSKLTEELKPYEGMVNIGRREIAKDVGNKLNEEAPPEGKEAVNFYKEIADTQSHELSHFVPNPNAQVSMALEKLRRHLTAEIASLGVMAHRLESQRAAGIRALNPDPTPEQIQKEQNAHLKRVQQWAEFGKRYKEWKEYEKVYAGWPRLAADFDSGPTEAATALAQAITRRPLDTLREQDLWRDKLAEAIEQEKTFTLSPPYPDEDDLYPAGHLLHKAPTEKGGKGLLSRIGQTLGQLIAPDGPDEQPRPRDAAARFMSEQEAAPTPDESPNASQPHTRMAKGQPHTAAPTLDFDLGGWDEASSVQPMPAAAPRRSGQSFPSVPPTARTSRPEGESSHVPAAFPAASPSRTWPPPNLGSDGGNTGMRGQVSARPRTTTLATPSVPHAQPPNAQTPNAQPLSAQALGRAASGSEVMVIGAEPPLGTAPQLPPRPPSTPDLSQLPTQTRAASRLAQPAVPAAWEDEWEDEEDMPFGPPLTPTRGTQQVSPLPAASRPTAQAAPAPAPLSLRPAPAQASAPTARSAGVSRRGATALALPSERLLDPLPNVARNTVALDAAAAQRKDMINSTLQSFGLQAKVLDFARGPTVTRYEIEPAPGEKISRIASLSNDLARALAVGGVRVEAPVPGKSVIGLEVPNAEREPVTFHQAVATPAFQQTRAKLPIILGKSIDGSMMVGDLAKMPHLLVAGSTGSGKSVCVNTIITSLLYKYLPTELRFLMVDPKMVELTPYDGIPHLVRPVVTNPADAAGVLLGAVAHMERRYKMMSAVGAKNLEQFNAKMRAVGEVELPHLVIIIDELADLMITSPKEVESAIMRLAQMARATGMHLILATQRPSVDILTSLIKVNIPARIAFAVSSSHDSRTILDATGAERLTGMGDMLFYQPGLVKPLRLQGPYISEAESVKITDELRRMTFEDDFVEAYGADFEGLISSSGQSSDRSQMDFSDPLLRQAALICIEEGQGSVSRLQRRLSVGHARAGKLMDLLEAMQIVGPHQGSKPREVLITEADLPEYFGK